MNLYLVNSLKRNSISSIQLQLKVNPLYQFKFQNYQKILVKKYSNIMLQIYWKKPCRSVNSIKIHGNISVELFPEQLFSRNTAQSMLPYYVLSLRLPIVCLQVSQATLSVKLLWRLRAYNFFLIQYPKQGEGLFAGGVHCSWYFKFLRQ